MPSCGQYLASENDFSIGLSSYIGIIPRCLGDISGPHPVLYRLKVIHHSVYRDQFETEAHRASNERLTAITAVITPPAGNVIGPEMIRRKHFTTTNLRLAAESRRLAGKTLGLGKEQTTGRPPFQKDYRSQNPSDGKIDIPLIIAMERVHFTDKEKDVREPQRLSYGRCPRIPEKFKYLEKFKHMVSKNFITVEKDKQAFLNQHNAMKQAASMATKTPQEPCQNSSYNKANKKKNIFYVVDEDEYPTSATIVQEKRWKV
ncbi:hypothetical protein YC2023_066483 [Brassica napus]